MTVIEVGIIKAGIPVYIKNFQEKNQPDNTHAHILKSAFMSAIQSSITLSFARENIENFELKFKKHIILISEINHFLFYAVTNKDSKFLFPIKECVAKLARDLDLSLLHDFDVNANVEIIEPKIVEIFRDVIQTPSQRVKRAFS